MTFTDRAAPILDTTEYPSTWDDYIGQVEGCTKLRIAAASARIKGKPMDHTLIVGPSGVGKTALAKLVADEIGKPCRTANPQTDGRTARLMLLGMKDGDVLHIDEFHQLMRLSANKREWLLQYMLDFTMPGPLGMEPMPHVTILASTSEPQTIPENILRRFLVRVTLEGYDTEEAAQIVQVGSRKILGSSGLPLVEGADATSIAEAALRNPGAIKRFLTTLCDVTLTGHIDLTENATYDIEALLAYMDVTPDGLDRNHREYLRVLAEEFGGISGERQLAGRLVLAESMALIEAPLLDAGYVALTPQGRQLTAAGIARYHDLAAVAA